MRWQHAPHAEFMARQTAMAGLRRGHWAHNRMPSTYYVLGAGLPVAKRNRCPASACVAKLVGSIHGNALRQRPGAKYIVCTRRRSDRERAIRRVTDTAATGRSTNVAIRGVLASGQGGTVPQEPVQRSMAVRALPRRVHSMYICGIAAPARASQKKSPLSAGSSSIRNCQFGW